MRAISFLVGLFLIVVAYEVRHATSSAPPVLRFPFQDLKDTLFLPDCDPIPDRTMCISDCQYRTFDGTCNNLCRINLGAAGTPHERLKGLSPSTAFAPDFKPRKKSVTGAPLPNARNISVNVFVNGSTNENGTRPNFTHATMTWGQFLDHDLTLTGLVPNIECGTNNEPCPERKGCTGIDILPGNELADNQSAECIPLRRSLQDNVGEQFNNITHYIDGSMVYGSNKETAMELRDPDDPKLLDVRVYGMSGKMCGLLPEAEGEAFCRSPNPKEKPCVRAGDERVNENQALTAMHTIWVREHNRIAECLHELNPKWDDERVFQETRKIVIAEIQHITYNEWLKVLFEDSVLQANDLDLEPKGQHFKEYDAKIADGRTINSMATAALRMGHTLIREFFNLRFFSKQVRNRRLFRGGVIPTADFFNAAALIRGKCNFIGEILLGLVVFRAQLIDRHFSSAVRENLIFEGPTIDGIVGDLPAINIQRGRDHGLPGYTVFVKACGGPDIRSFDQLRLLIPEDQIPRLKEVYDRVEDIDLWVGGISEFPALDSQLGFTFTCILTRQMRKSRFGDRFWYEINNVVTGFPIKQVDEIRHTSLSRVMCDNACDIFFIQINGFKVATRRNGSNPVVDCDFLPKVDLTVFKEEHEKMEEEPPKLTV